MTTTLLNSSNTKVNLPPAMPTSAGNYTIVESALPIAFGRAQHNLTVVKDPTGAVIAEFDGLATDSSGNIQPMGFFNDSLKVYVTDGSYLYSPTQTQAVVFSGSYSQVSQLVNTAATCGAAINAKNLAYPFGGLGSNSNSVESTLDACMNVTEPASVAKSTWLQPGQGTLLLSPAEIKAAQTQNGLVATTAPNADYVTNVTNNGSVQTVTVAEPDGSSQIISIPTGATSGTADQKSYFSNGSLNNDEQVTYDSTGAITAAVITGGAVGSALTCELGNVPITANSVNLTLFGDGDCVHMSGQGYTLAANNTAVGFANGTTASIIGYGNSYSLSANDNISADTGITSSLRWDGPTPAVQNVSATGTGNIFNTQGAVDWFAVDTTGIAATFNGTAQTIWGTGSATLNTGLPAPGRVTVNMSSPNVTDVKDGSTLSIGGTGEIFASYGAINLAPNANVYLGGYNEQLNGSSTDQIQYGGTDEIINAPGATITPDGGAEGTILGSSTVNLVSSDVAINVSNSTVVNNTTSLSDIDLSGTYISITGSGSGGTYDIFGTSNTNSTNNSTSYVWGSTSGDINTGSGSTIIDYSSPDTIAPPTIVSWVDPIILNLTGAKVQTQNLTSSTAYFDVQNVGKAVHTGWGTAGEGYLDYDPTGKTTVTHEADLVTSFAALKLLDTNGDGILSALDSTWANLKVWVDSVGNGTFTAGSLKTMDQLNIASINLNSTHVNQLQNNNTILDDSTFTWKTGGTGDIAGIDFNYHAAAVVTVTSGGGGGGSASCVQFESLLPGGGIAGDIRAGERMALADETTLEAAIGVVTYSERKTAPGYRIVTVSGISLVCSDTAPIPTRQGLILAPALMGHEVAVRKDEAGSTLVGWEKVASITSVGPIEIQHISINDKCFWAGERKDAFILHHNKVAP